MFQCGDSKNLQGTLAACTKKLGLASDDDSKKIVDVVDVWPILSELPSYRESVNWTAVVCVVEWQDATIGATACDAVVF